MTITLSRLTVSAGTVEDFLADACQHFGLPPVEFKPMRADSYRARGYYYRRWNGKPAQITLASLVKGGTGERLDAYPGATLAHELAHHYHRTKIVGVKKGDPVHGPDFQMCLDKTGPYLESWARLHNEGWGS